MNILVLGASGLVGSAVFHALAREHHLCGTYFSQRGRCAGAENMFPLDIADGDAFAGILEKAAPQVIISCLCGDFAHQLRLHERAADYLSRVPHGKLLYVSSANVFDALDTLPHYEDDAPAALSDYGQFKLNCEQLLTARLGENAVILRPPFIWGRHSPRLDAIVQAVKAGTPVKAWSNLSANHTTDLQIARFVALILKENRTGIFHVGTDAPCDYLGFIKALLHELRLPMPALAIEEMPYPCCLAVLSARADLPAELRMTNEALLRSLAT